jgi:hypothetical protein
MKTRNIQFTYSYTDYNRKLTGYVVLANPADIPIETINATIRSGLIDGTSFDPSEWGVAPISSYDFDESLDDCWNEFGYVDYTFRKPTTKMGVEELLAKVERWKDEQKFWLARMVG